ncbi:MAG: hypothetical protein D6784_09735, partial [Chloroflexi bacterium]
NILLDRHGDAYLTDFGLALLTSMGTRGEILGSPHYLSPEQAISSAGVTPQSDLYALGVILYRCFTGRLPFDAADPLDVVLLQMDQPPPPPRQVNPAVPPALEAVILRALEKEPENRYPTGQALADALEAALSDIEGTAVPLPEPPAEEPSEPVPVPQPSPSSDTLSIPPAASPARPGEPPSLVSRLSREMAPSSAASSAPPAPARPAGRRPVRAIAAVAVLLLLLAGLGIFLFSSGPSESAEATVASVSPSPTRRAAALPAESTRAPAPTLAPTPTVPPTPAETLTPTAKAEQSSAQDVLALTPTPAGELSAYRLLFTQWDGGKHSVWVVNLDGSGKKRLSEYAASPSWTADGERVVFLGETGINSLPRTPDGGSEGVWRMTPDGLYFRQLIQDGRARSVAASPVGNLIVFDSKRGDNYVLYFIDAQGTELPTQIPGETPAWSPDGQWVVAKACRPNCGLWLTRRDGSRPVQLTFDGGDGLPAWAPDNSRIAFSRPAGSGVDIFTVRPDGSDLRQLTSSPGHDTLPAWTPDSQQIVFRSTRNGFWQLFIMNRDGTDQRPLLPDNLGSSDEWAFDRMSVH